MRCPVLWIDSCVHYIRDWFSVDILSTKSLTVWKTPSCAAVAEHRRLRRLRGECCSVCTEQSSRSKYICLIQGNKGKGLKLFSLSSFGLSVTNLVSLTWLTERIVLHMQWLEKYINHIKKGFNFEVCKLIMTTKAQLHRVVIWSWLTVCVSLKCFVSNCSCMLWRWRTLSVCRGFLKWTLRNVCTVYKLSDDFKSGADGP